MSNPLEDQPALKSFPMGRPAVVKTVEEIDEDSERMQSREIPPGFHRLRLRDFQPLKEALDDGLAYKQYDAWLNGEKKPYQAGRVGVRFEQVDDPGATIVAWMVLPPLDKGDLELYTKGTKYPGNKNPGAFWTMLRLMLARLNPDWDSDRGELLPDDAYDTTKWIGLEAYAEIRLKDQVEADGSIKVDKTTNEPLPPVSDLNNFSWKSVKEVDDAGGPAAFAPKPSRTSSRPSAAPSPSNNTAPAERQRLARSL